MTDYNWIAGIPRGSIIHVKVPNGSTLTLKGAFLPEPKKGNVASLFIDRELKYLDSGCSRTELRELLGILDSDGVNSIHLNQELTKDFLLEQTGNHGAVAVFGVKSNLEDKIDIAMFPLPYEHCKNKFQFIHGRNYESPFKGELEKLPEAEQKQIKDDNKKRLKDFKLKEDELEKLSKVGRNQIKDDNLKRLNELKLKESKETVSTSSSHVKMVKALVVLKSTEGVSGTIYLTQKEDGSSGLTGTISGLKAGMYGFHIQALGDTTSGRMSPGSHFIPAGSQHRAHEGQELHDGALGNLTVGEDGKVVVNIVNKQIPFTGPNSIIGRAVVLHADTYKFGKGGPELRQSTSNAGKTIAWGTISLVG